MLVQCCVFLVFQFSFASLHTNNVCKTFRDYSTIDNNPNCWYNPDINSSPAQIARRYGYPMKKYKVTTKDGYILTLFRIPHNNTDLNSIRQPVLIQHGIAARAIFWMLLGHSSTAFFLANNGYDVWLSTARGEDYSSRHENLTMEDPLYWNFGFHEMAIYDLPAIVEVISNITRQKGNIIYIGHSMGTTTSYIYSSVKKDHAEEHLKALISLSPVAYMKNIQGLYKSLIPFVDNIVMFLKAMGVHAIGDHIPLIKEYTFTLCSTYPTINYCELFLALASGLAVNQVRPDILPVFTNYFPGGTSLKTFQHFAQLISSEGKFQHFDHGIGNFAVYNSFIPPPYDVRAISIPVYLFIGRQDFIAPEKDVDILYEKLNSPESGTNASKFYCDFAHNDYFMGRDLGEFYETLLDVMKNKIGNKS